MQLTRRQMVAVFAGGAVASLTGLSTSSAFAAADAATAIKAFAGGDPQVGRITLTAPEIAENGNTVPISISVESPMTEDDYVEAVAIYADGNPVPIVATFKFSPLSGQATATTRVRLAKSQNVIAVAKMKDGSTFMDTKQVKVTIGGCGG